jgi:four helix bundle protein
MFKFEELKVWQKALDITEDVHILTLTFPKEELFILATQIKRPADSIALNIAEGSTGQTNPEQKRFLGMAIRSAVEVVACLHIGKRRELINQTQFDNIYTKLNEVIKMLQAFRKVLE